MLGLYARVGHVGSTGETKMASKKAFTTATYWNGHDRVRTNRGLLLMSILLEENLFMDSSFELEFRVTELE